MDLKIEYIPLSDIKPYRRNAKKHPQSQIDQIAASIERFGMNDPIGVSGDENEIVEGHGRYLACRQMNIDRVPVIHLDHLSGVQRRAYNLIHNNLTMSSDFNLKALAKELDAISAVYEEFKIDMADYGFDVQATLDEWEQQHEQNKQQERFDDSNILNLERGQFPGVGPYDIPQLQPLIGLPEITEWIGWNYLLSEKHPEGKGVHFYLNDYQFERIWRSPERYVEKLQRFAVVATPDFSPYGDMPFCLQLYNHYRKHWVGAFLQAFGIRVIPTIRASTDPRSMDFYLDGEPSGGSVTISSMWTRTDEEKSVFLEEYKRMYDTLNPERVYLYGKMMDGIPGNITRIPTFSETRFCKR